MPKPAIDKWCPQCGDHVRLARQTFCSAACRISGTKLRFDDCYVADPSGCLIWKRGLDTHGYGQFIVEGRCRLAHRYAFERVHGPIPDGMCACHSCDNRRCVNVAHMFLGSNADNVRDAAMKGRKAMKLSPADVLKIRAIGKHRSQESVARSFGVTRRSIGMILRGTSWQWLNHATVPPAFK